MRPIRRAIVIGLEWSCSVLDRLPRYDREDHRWHSHGCLGCYPLDLAGKSLALDDRWQTGVWTGSDPKIQ